MPGGSLGNPIAQTGAGGGLYGSQSTIPVLYETASVTLGSYGTLDWLRKLQIFSAEFWAEEGSNAAVTARSSAAALGAVVGFAVIAISTPMNGWGSSCRYGELYDPCKSTTIFNEEAAKEGATEGADDSGSERERGLPPEGIVPPVAEPGKLTVGPASRPAERKEGGKSLWDANGGEWRYYPEDKWHNPHWDYNPHDQPKGAPWQNVPIGDLPPRKLKP
jgi:hypothetical protein